MIKYIILGALLIVAVVCIFRMKESYPSIGDIKNFSNILEKNSIDLLRYISDIKTLHKISLHIFNTNLKKIKLDNKIEVNECLQKKINNYKDIINIINSLK